MDDGCITPEAIAKHLTGHGSVRAVRHFIFLYANSISDDPTNSISKGSDSDSSTKSTEKFFGLDSGTGKPPDGDTEIPTISGKAFIELMCAYHA